MNTVHPRARRARIAALVALATAALAGITVPAAAVAATTDTNCRVVITGAPWKLLTTKSGSTYTLAARGMPCATARPFVVKLTHLTGTGPGQLLKGGPAGFTCRSFATTASGDHLVYSGVCTKGPHNHPFFEWGPKVS